MKDLPFFNTYELGVDASLLFPKFLLPVSQERFSKSYKPETRITLGYNFQDRTDYDHWLTNVAFGYEWTESKYKIHNLYPADISLIKINPTPAFDSILNTITDQRLKSQYTDHLITALRYSFIFNTQELNRLKNFIFFRGNFEISGNLLNIIQRLGGIKENSDGYRTLFNIRYAQYVRPNIEFRYYFLLSRTNSVVFRAFTGLAIPYGNSIAMPFEKGYYAGGSNGMRGWPLRGLGPGSWSPQDISIERIGDVHIETNLEYRFPVYRFLKGGLFIDVGNVWLLKENELFPNGEISGDRFLQELAMDGGLGFRFDFNFFIIRLDVAHKLRDPVLPAGNRWITNLQWRTMTWNFGIGYPF